MSTAVEELNETALLGTPKHWIHWFYDGSGNIIEHSACGAKDKGIGGQYKCDKCIEIEHDFRTGKRSFCQICGRDFLG